MVGRILNRVRLEGDEIDDLIDAVEHSALLAELLAAKGDVKLWKWLIISLHSAIQGACVCAIRGYDTSGSGVLDNVSRKAWLEWYSERSQENQTKMLKNRRIASLATLLERVRDEKFLPSPSTLIVDKNYLDDIDMLNYLRNDFIHFGSKGWSLGLEGMPRIVHHVCDVIEKLVIAHPGPYLGFRRDETLPERIEAALARTREGVAAWAATV